MWLSNASVDHLNKIFYYYSFENTDFSVSGGDVMNENSDEVKHVIKFINDQLFSPELAKVVENAAKDLIVWGNLIPWYINNIKDTKTTIFFKFAMLKTFPNVDKMNVKMAFLIKDTKKQMHHTEYFEIKKDGTKFEFKISKIHIGILRKKHIFAICVSVSILFAIVCAVLFIYIQSKKKKMNLLELQENTGDI